MSTVTVHFANIHRLLEVEVNKQTERVIGWLWRSNGVYSCSRNSWEKILLKYAKDKNGN